MGESFTVTRIVEESYTRIIDVPFTQEEWDDIIAGRTESTPPPIDISVCDTERKTQIPEGANHGVERVEVQDYRRSTPTYAQRIVGVSDQSNRTANETATGNAKKARGGVKTTG